MFEIGAESYLRVVDRVYREVLSRGVIFTRCDCIVHDGGLYSGDSSSVVDVLNLRKDSGWQALTWYRFQISVDKFGGKKFSLATDSKFALSIFDNSTDLETNIRNAMVEILRNWRRGWARWGIQTSKCSIGFVSGTELEDVPTSHPMILPTLVAALANLKAEFFQQADALVKTGGPKYTSHKVETALDSLLNRYSAFASQAVKEQTERLFGFK